VLILCSGYHDFSGNDISVLFAKHIRKPRHLPAPGASGADSMPGYESSNDTKVLASAFGTLLYIPVCAQPWSAHRSNKRF
jgi:hypothetical protein